MEYQKINVNAFAGVDVNKRPEMIEDTQASDIENLRFDKVGYLINRNGVKSKPLRMVNQAQVDVRNVLWPIGTMGLTEYILKAPWGPGSGTESWAPYDDATVNTFFPAQPVKKRFSDRFMVSAIRIPTTGDALGSATISYFDNYNKTQRDQNGFTQSLDNHYTWRYKAAYVLIPLYGPSDFRDTFAFLPNGLKFINNPSGQGIIADPDYPSMHITAGARAILRADDKPSRTQIYAPVRWQGVHNTFEFEDNPKDSNWITHYVSMNQYADSIVISDLTNGDLQLVDEYAEAEYSEARKHRFTLRENCLAKFDIDDVVIDFGIGVDAANGGNEGIEAPLALYKFYLPRKRLTTGKQFEPIFTAPGVKESPNTTGVSDTPAGESSTWRPIDPSKLNYFFSAEEIYGETEARDLINGGPANSFRVNGISFNVLNQYTYTNNLSSDEYDDVFGAVTLANPDIKEDNQVSSDVYLWKDIKIKYYPSSGISSAYGPFLNDKDRTWDKTSSANIKLVKLKTHAGVEQEVPLGVWRYRFVWYMGNGEYSAPSAELVVPDMLFSGLKDSDITSVFPTYKRPVGCQNIDESLSTAMDLSSANNLFINDLPIAQGAKIFQNDGPPNAGTLTTFGKNFITIKEALYDPNHRFAALKSTTSGASWPNISLWDSEQYEAKGNVSTICTLHFPNNDETLNSYIGEAAYSQYAYEGKTVINYDPRTLSMLVPIYKRESEKFSYNSLLTDSGVIRTVYQNRIKYQSSSNFNPGYPAYDVVLTGRNDPDDREYDIIREGKVYLNIIAFANAFAQDRNNSDDDDLYQSNFRLVYRNMTQVRGVKNESDRLSYLKPGVPPEVASRIVLSGSAEIDLCNFGDTGTYRPEESYSFVPVVPYPTQIVNNCEYATQRNFINFSQPPYWNNIFPPVLGSVTEHIKSNDPAYTANNAYIKFNNLKVVISAPGERLLVHEQLSMYVPASLLFEAPHVKIIVPADRIPRRARQLMIFRTRASHDNAWQPHEYGLVKAIDVIRDPLTGKPSADHATEIKFLDDIKSKDLDFSYNVAEYDAFVEPIKSRFCLPLNERVFYSNIVESYKPQAPRNPVKFTADPNKSYQVSHKNLNVGAGGHVDSLWNYKVILGTAATTQIDKRYLYYFISYSDVAKASSSPALLGVIDRGDLQAGDNAKKKVILYCLPSAYDSTIEQLNIYRLNTNTPLAAVPFGFVLGNTTYRRMSVNIYTSGVFYVAQGVVEYNGVVYYPNSVIKAFDGGDTGVPDVSNIGGNNAFTIGVQGYLNRFVDYFSQDTSPYSTIGVTNRGAQGTYGSPIIYDVTNVFDGSTGPSAVDFIEKIGSVKPEDEGIFYDDDLPALGRLPLLQFFQNPDITPAGLRWSEPYQPNKLKLGSLMEVRSGDGDQITGMVQLYGNIVILKERSMHRLAVQGSAVPVSRVDEISNTVGCIAPNTAITVDNTLYFLSWAGFYKYDNNVLSKIDGSFAEELQIRLRSNVNGVMNPAIRDASCGWNPTYREIYLNIPVMSTDNNEGHYGTNLITGDHTQGVTLMDNIGEREVRGHIYAINIDTGFVTKYRYMDDALYFTDPNMFVPSVLFPNAPTQRAPRTMGKIYYTNTLGQMRSVDILPPRTFNFNIPTKPISNNASTSYLQASFYIESPTKESLTSLDKYGDDMMMYTQDQSGNWQNLTNTRNVRIFWASKSWVGEDKTTLKRIRKVFSYISNSVQPPVLRGVVHTSPTGDRSTTDITWEYPYYESNQALPSYGQSVVGELLAIPTEASGSSSSPSQNRGERHVFQVEGGGAFQMEYFGFYWKPINGYQR